MATEYLKERECPICDGTGSITVKTLLSPAQREAALSPGARLHCVLLANDYSIDFEAAVKLYHETFEKAEFPSRSWDSFDADLRNILLTQQVIPSGMRVVDVELDGPADGDADA